MKILYLDCFAGISGDMTLGALIDAGAVVHEIEAGLSRLGLPDLRLSIASQNKYGIKGTVVNVQAPDVQPHRTFPAIKTIYENSTLPPGVKDRALKVFRLLAEAEGNVHGTSPEEVHFHEMGALDALVEITGVAIALESMGIQKIVSSPLPLSSGFVDCAHGKLPVPVPAVMELIKGIPTRTTDVEGELVTPTGAALAVALADSFGPMPAMVISTVGYGAGTAVFTFPNMLRAVVGESEISSISCNRLEEIVILETTVDDLNPEFIPHIIERLLEEGALDVFMTPAVMKKGRAGINLSVICKENGIRTLIQAVVEETGSLGVRIRREHRHTADRQTIQVETSYGTVRVKISHHSEKVFQVKPEFEDCRLLARKTKTPLRVVFEAARRAALEAL